MTSGTHSPVLGHPIALGYVLPVFAEVGTEVVVLSRGRRIPARVVERPFYRRGVTPVPRSRRRPAGGPGDRRRPPRAGNAGAPEAYPGA